VPLGRKDRRGVLNESRGRVVAEHGVTDYWLNKLFFDLQQPGKSAEFKRDKLAVLANYPMDAKLRDAVLADDLAAIAPHANAYLLRFYYAILGVKDEDFIKRLNALAADGVPHNG
jgi:hypothetical protein